MTVAVEVTEAMKTLPDLVKRVKNGDEIVLSDSATPVARIMRIVAKEGRRVPGTGIGKFIVHDSFDDPLPEDLMRGFEKEL